MSRKLSEVCDLNLYSEIWQSNRGIPVAIMTLIHLHNYPLAVLPQCSALQWWCQGQRGLLLAKKGNSQTTHGSIVVEWELNVYTEKVKKKKTFVLYEKWNQTSLRYWGRDEMVAGRWIRIALMFVPHIAALVQIMAWRWPGDKPSSEQCWLVYVRIYASLGINELASILT